MKIISIFILNIFGFLLLLSCAHIEAPSGGPKDSTPPRITGVFPHPGSTNNSRDLNITLEFSEWVAADWARAVYVSQITLSPALPRKLKFEIKGKKIQITSNSKLEPATTYILSVNNSLADLNGQKLSGNFNLIFSTGPQLDSGSLSGVLESSGNSKGDKSWVGLYPLGPSRDSLFHLNTPFLESPAAFPDPEKERPQYLIKVDSANKISYAGVKKGRYAVLGFEDLNSNLKPDVGTEKLAIGDTVSIDELRGVNLKLNDYTPSPLKLNTVKWKGYSLDSVNQKVTGVLSIEMNRPVRWQDFPIKDSLSFISLMTMDSTKITGITGLHYPHDLHSTYIDLHLTDLAMSTDYMVILSGLMDIYANPLDSLAYKKTFTIDSVVDTSQYQLKLQEPAPKDTSVILNAPIRLTSTRPLSGEDVKTLQENLIVKVNDAETPVNLKKIDFQSISIDLPLKEYTGQKVVIQQKKNRPQGVTDSLVKLPPDTSKKMIGEFSLANSEKWGSLELLHEKNLKSRTVFLKKINSKKEKKYLLPEKKACILDSLMEGQYFIRYFQDTNNNGIWDVGSLDPWGPQEAHFNFQDTLVIEADEKRTFHLDVTSEELKTP